MKRSVFGVAIGLALVATAANAQSVVPAAKPVSFGIAGGMSVPTGDFGDGFKSGYNVSGLVQFQQPTWKPRQKCLLPNSVFRVRSPLTRDSAVPRRSAP